MDNPATTHITQNLDLVLRLLPESSPSGMVEGTRMSMSAYRLRLQTTSCQVAANKGML
jgi:hypothetical protein